MLIICWKNSKLKTQNSKLKTQNSKLKTQNSKPKTETETETETETSSIMCVMSKHDVGTETIIVVRSDSLFYANRITDEEDENPPNMAFSHSVPKNTGYVRSRVVEKKDFGKLIDLYEKTFVKYPEGEQSDSSNCGYYEVVHQGGFCVQKGDRYTMYKKVIKDANETEKKCLWALMDPAVKNHGTHAIIASPTYAKNDWNGILIDFFDTEGGRQLKFDDYDIGNITVPTCHETPDYDGLLYEQLVLLDSKVHRNRPFRSHTMIADKIPGGVFPFFDDKNRCIKSSNNLGDGYCGMVLPDEEKFTFGDEEGVYEIKTPYFLKLDTRRTMCNKNLVVRDMINFGQNVF